MVTLRSGLEYDGPTYPVDWETDPIPKPVGGKIKEKKQEGMKNKVVEKPKKPKALENKEEQKNVAANVPAKPKKLLLIDLDYRPPPPYPQRFKYTSQDTQFKKLPDILKKLHINIPLVETLKQMSNYVKFLKDILSKKQPLGEFKTVAQTECSSALLKSKVPPKLKDPGSFTIRLCSIGGRNVGRALFDLGASINLMSYSVFK